MTTIKSLTTKHLEFGQIIRVRARIMIRATPVFPAGRPELSGAIGSYPQIEDVLRLAPLQEDLLFHALYDAQAPDIYTARLELGLEGAYDGAAMTAAVQGHASRRALSDRHATTGATRSGPHARLHQQEGQKLPADGKSRMLNKPKGA